MVTKDEKTTESYHLLLDSSRVSKDVKDLIKDTLFLDQNEGLVIELARLLFLVDSIQLDNNEIVARKKVTRIVEPKIPIDEAIFRYLIKIKHDSLTADDIEKLNDLQQYPSYQTLYKYISLAIDQKVKIKKFHDDSSLKMSLAELKVFLLNG